MTLRGLFSPEKSSHEHQRANQSKAEKNKSSPVRGHPPHLMSAAGSVMLLGTDGTTAVWDRVS